MSYPGSIEIVTQAQVKSLNNITNTDSDTFITNLIPSVCRSVESYCRRRFCKYTWIQWYDMDRTISTDEWPINNVLYIGQPIIAFTITDTSNNLTFSITQENSRNLNVESKLSVTDNANLASTDYTFAMYSNVGSLTTAVETAYPTVTFTNGTTPSLVNFDSINTKTLRPTIGKTVYAGWDIFNQTTSLQIGEIYRLSDNSDRILLNPNLTMTSYMFNQYNTGYANIDDMGYQGSYSTDDVLVIWNSGYTNANMPQELQWVVSSIIQDVISLYDEAYKGNMIKEGLGDYNYQLDPTSKVSELIYSKYKDALDIFKKKVIA